MKKLLYLPWLLSLSAIIYLLPGCVSRKQHDDLQTRYKQLQTDKQQTDDKLGSLSTQKADLDKQLAALAEETKKLRLDSMQSGIMYRKNKSLLEDLFQKSDRLQKSYDQLLANSSTENSTLNRDLARREKELFALEQSLKTGKADLEKSRAQIGQLSEDLKKREQRVVELEKVLADKDKAVADLKAKVANALLSFNQSDLNVSVKNGKVYVSLSEQLLFKSGSYNIETKGADALRKLSSVLTENKDINVVVEGHTDDVPLAKNTPGIADNWDLSVLRATSIVRILTREGVPGSRLTAAGHGEFLPLNAGKSTEIRQKNRRVEIILTPKLDELFNILNNN